MWYYIFIGYKTSWISWVQVRKIHRPEFLCFNQRHFIFITLSWRYLFPSIFWSTANDNYYIAGSIPSLLLSGSCKEYGFADITTRFFWRLTNNSSSTSSDYRYVIFGHDLMCSISANYCDMRQHRKGMTSSNTAAGGLDLRCKDD